jgi:DeoR family transcriptional regulator, ulaG and ulaABCDEF operon transcriptional repressor
MAEGGVMHEIERHRIILSEVADRPVATLARLVELTGASEATVRRDVSALHVAGRLRRVRGGAEALYPPQTMGIAGRPFSVNETVNVKKKQAIARAAVDLCEDGESIIINGGTTTYQMVDHLAGRRLQILTNSFPIAEHLLKNSKSTITVPGGAIYREQNIILSPFDNDVTRNFYARRMFMSAQGVSALGVMEGDPLLIQAEQKLISQAEELILLVDSSKFGRRSSLILCPLKRVSIVITDDGVPEDVLAMLRNAGPKVMIVEAGMEQRAAG